jgi:transketolase
MMARACSTARISEVSENSGETAASAPVQVLRQQARRIRTHILAMGAGPEGAHVGGALSATDVLTTLFFHVLRLRPEEPKWAERDYFILSKGHASAALYAALAERGFLPVEELTTYARTDSRLAGHPLRKVPGVEFPTGSLGHGLSLGIGLALAARRDRRPNRTFVLLGDGELQEGSVWEAIMAAAHFQLANLTAIVDRNGLQITGSTEDVCQLSPLDEKFEAFGFGVQRCDGNDIGELVRTFEAVPFRPGKPSVVLAKTRKGKGVSFMENVAKWHHGVPNEEEFNRAMAELEAAEAAMA